MTSYLKPLQLLEQFLQMLTLAQLFDYPLSSVDVDLNVCRSAIRILLACISENDKDVSLLGFIISTHYIMVYAVHVHICFHEVNIVMYLQVIYDS